MSNPVTRASTASRWMFCPEAAWLEQNYPDSDGDEAREGTAAHEMAELVLNNVVSSPDELVDRVDENGVVMSGEMVPHVQMYVDYVRSHGGECWIEEPISIECRQNKPVTGKCDGAAFVYNPATGELFIDDFKYGFGQIDVLENWQLIIYALGIYEKKLIDSGIKKITMSIIQPRGYHQDGPIRTWTITQDQLIGYYNILRTAVDLVYSDDRQFVTGSHCRRCKVLADCAMAKAASMNAVDVIGDTLPTTDTPEQIANLLVTLERASESAKHMLDAVIARAEAMILEGKVIPGRAMMPGTGNRKFINNDEAIALGSIYGVKMTDDNIITPSEAERRGFDKNLMKTIATSPSTAPRLVKFDASIQADQEFK